MESTDSILETIVRKWANSKPARVETTPQKSGSPPVFVVVPNNPAAISVRLWVSDSGTHVALSFGLGSWWDEAVPLDEKSVNSLLDALSSASAGEEIRSLFGRTIGHRGFVHLQSGVRLESIQSLGLPWLKWHAVVYEAYS